MDKPNECGQNFVEILYGREMSLVSSKEYCSSRADSVKVPKGSAVTFRFFADSSTLEGFKPTGGKAVVAVATELRERNGKSEEWGRRSGRKGARLAQVT